jgi:hypothetical protein
VSIEQLESAAYSLGELVEEVAFLGGAAIPLWISDPAAPPVRATRDVDVIVEVASRGEYYALGERLRAHRFEEDPQAPHVCAWRHRDTELRLDVMPTDAGVLGFSNEWYQAGLRAAIAVDLPSGMRIRAVPPAFLIATKLVAFRSRGGSDYLTSRDFGDIVVIADGRPELIAEVEAAPVELRSFLASEFERMRTAFAFRGGVAGALLPDLANQARVGLVLSRIEAIVAAIERDRRAN